MNYLQINLNDSAVPLLAFVSERARRNYWQKLYIFVGKLSRNFIFRFLSLNLMEYSWMTWERKLPVTVQNLWEEKTVFHAMRKSSNHALVCVCVCVILPMLTKIKGLQRHLKRMGRSLLFFYRKINWFLAAKSLILFDFSIKSGRAVVFTIDSSCDFCRTIRWNRCRKNEKSMNWIRWLLLKGMRIFVQLFVSFR